MKKIFNRVLIMFVMVIATISQQVDGQSAIGQLETMSGGKVSTSSSSSASMKSMVSGAILQSLFTSLLTSSEESQKDLDARQQAERLEAQQAAAMAAQQQRIREAAAQAEYDKMMQSYKLLDDAGDFKAKTLDSPSLDFKSLDGEAESLSADARKQFESEGTTPLPASTGVTGTPFFGDVLSADDLQMLTDLDNNPDIVDLRNAVEYVDQKTAQDSAGIVSLLRSYESEVKGEPIVMKPDCIKLRNQLKGLINQREQFQKTIDLSQSEIDTWEKANNNALVNAAKDGLEYFTGELLEGLTNRGKAADRLQVIYNSKVNQMAGEGINVAEIQTKIDRLRAISSTGQIANFATNVNDWETFIKDGMSSLMAGLTGSNDEIKGLLNDPKLSKYFQAEAPELNTLLDISKLAASNMVFGKWVARKMPVIAVIELSINQAYNGLDYYLSLNRIMEAKKIHGGVMETARYIQKNIDDTYLALTSCPQ